MLINRGPQNFLIESKRGPNFEGVSKRTSMSENLNCFTEFHITVPHFWSKPADIGQETKNIDEKSRSTADFPKLGHSMY